MGVWLLILIILVSAALLWFWLHGRKPPARIDALDAAAGVTPTTVALPDASESEERPRRRRTGETQELRRKVLHGPYRAIDDRGDPSSVHMGEKL